MILKEYNYDIDKISEFIGSEFKKRLTNDFIDHIHTRMGAGSSNYPEIREQLACLIENKFLDDLYYYLTSRESQV